jgi:serine/threonine protein phosphatase PrpC
MLRLEHHAAWLTNTKGKPYEDRFLLPLGQLPERLEAARSDEEERSVQARIDAVTARGLLFAVLDGVGGAPLGMRAAQRGVDALRELYTRRPPAEPPTARELLALLHEANADIASWGTIGGAADIGAADADPVGAGASGRPLGAACITAAYLSPAGNLTLFQAGDTAAFVYRPRRRSLALYTSASDVAGRSVRTYLGVGASLHIDTFPLTDLEPDDRIALVSDGVYPKGLATRDAVQTLLAEADGDANAVATALVERSRARGSVDDITALVLTVW